MTLSDPFENKGKEEYLIPKRSLVFQLYFSLR